MRKTQMLNIRDKIEKVWAALLHQRSKNYLVRAKIDQSIAIANSNLSSSFMGNRQLANHNTADIKYNLKKIAEKNLTGNNMEEENIELIFLQHQNKLNNQLFKNSKELLLALEQLQLAHKRVMKTNEDIIKFNTSLINSTSEIIQTDQLPDKMQLNKEEIVSELEKIQKKQNVFNKETENLLVRIDQLSKDNEEASKELNIKREKILENRNSISGLRADLSLWL